MMRIDYRAFRGLGPIPFIRYYTDICFGMVVVGLRYFIGPLGLPALVKFALVCLVGVPATFAVSGLIRALPGAKRVL